ncbi:glutamine synthetase [Chloropicon primus]|uniref:Lengsin n=1 Tax=Chloropicon primus TaxID=1764295 RepID=A0A5B8MM86_9CHLO|nr:glutamine synthetase [Chloropicon primus]|eukprot:QDZ21144.1 glutamine synthetase [Chloropicon primus]
MKGAGQATEVDYLRYEFTDYHGISRSKVVPTRRSEGRIRSEKLFVYGGVLGMTTTSEPVMLDDLLVDGCCRNVRLLPQWETFRVLPPNGKYKTGRVLCELGDLAGDGFLNAYPRTMCRRLLGELEDMGYSIKGAFEYEFTLGKMENGAFTPFFNDRPTFSTTVFAHCEELLYDLDRELQVMGIETNTFNLEYGKGQIEITIKPVFGIEIADQAFTFRTTVKEFFARKGLLATFVCRPLKDTKGASNGGHFNHSLWAKSSDSRSAFFNDGELSVVAHRWISGILKHSKGLEALFAPTLSCYNRVKPWSWAPVNASWGGENRTAAVRTKVDGEDGTYLECRAPSASASPYLVLAGVLAAGINGLRTTGPVELPPESQASAYEDETLKLPTSLGESLQALEEDADLVRSLGPRFVKWFKTVKEHKLSKDNVDEKHVDLDDLSLL